MDAVIHTANYVGVEHAENNMLVNLVMARVCGAAADRLERLVYVSSSGVFPNNGEAIRCAYLPVDELHPKRPVDEYSLSKLLGEEMVEAAARRTGLRTVIVRPSHVLSGSTLLSMFSVQRVVGLLRGHQHPDSELYLGDGSTPWLQIEESAQGSDQPCSVTDLEGRPWYYQPNDARDIAHLLVCAVEHPAALGESFNCGSPAPFSYPDAAHRLAELTGRDPLEVRVPVRWRYTHAIGKARSLIGYRPQGDLERMLESACRVQTEEYQDYLWD